MPPKELDDLMADLTAWCKAKHGRQKQLAAEMGVNDFTVSHWLAGRKRPSLDQYFALKDFLKKQHKRARTKRA